MNLLFLHQNMPGQFKHLVARLASDPANNIVFVTKRKGVRLPGVRVITYEPQRTASRSTHHYLRLLENNVLHGQQALRIALELRRGGFVPDVIIAHPGWGEPLFMKDVFPSSPLLNYCEFYYHGSGADIGYDPDQPMVADDAYRARIRNAHLLLSLESCDHGLSPTRWQKSVHPEAYQEKISVIFDGIDTEVVKPADAAHFDLPGGQRLDGKDEIVTYAARNLEPYRGFPAFIRALPKILASRPRAQVVIAGGDGIDYGRRHPSGQKWRETMLEEVAIDRSRVHFVGQLPYADYLSLLQVSSVHVYLTVPFVLSWSCIEALAAGCLVVGSRTPPVEEVIQDGENGFLADFLDPSDIAAKVIEALAQRQGLDRVRTAARESVLEHYALDKCLPRQVELVERLGASR
ncbi:MAG: putative glycosyltransferase, group 1 [Thermoleophilia bacterium]|nr:putative glycosyltransferase, group 1 [Thermoleophilia bacterium]